MNNSLVSIVIPAYNREKFISVAIESALNQTYKNIEIIIGDNCSTDNTWEIIEKYANADPRIHAFKNSTNLGPVLNWYECFKRVQGEYIKIIWSDDWISNDFIEKAIDIFDDDTAFVFSTIKLVDENGIEKYSYSYPSINEQKSYLFNVFISHDIEFPVSPGCAIFRSQDVRDEFVINITNEDDLDSLKNGAGNDLLLFLNIAYKYKYNKSRSDISSYFRIHDNSFTCSSNLERYYLWAMLFFLNNKKISKYKDVIKFRLMFRSTFDKAFKNLYLNLNFSSNLIMNFLVFMFYGFKKYSKKMYKRIVVLLV